MTVNKWVEYKAPNVIGENYRLLKLFSVQEGKENKCTERQRTWEAHKSDGISKSEHCKNKNILLTKNLKGKNRK